jgi:hypothetical protein
MGGIRNAYIILARRRELKGQLGIIVKWAYRNKVAECVLDSFDSGQGLEAGACEYCNQPSGCIKGREFFD